MALPKFLTSTQFAALYGKDVSTITRGLQSGRLPGFKDEKGVWWVRNPGSTTPNLIRGRRAPILTTAEVAKILGIGRRSVHNLRNSGRLQYTMIPALSGPGFECGYSLAEVRKQIERRCMKTKGWKKRVAVTRWAIEKILDRPLVELLLSDVSPAKPEPEPELR